MILFKKVLGQPLGAWIVQVFTATLLYFYNTKRLAITFTEFSIIFFILLLLYCLVLIFYFRIKNKE